MKTPQFALRLMTLSMKWKVAYPFSLATLIVKSCWAMTDSTSMSIRLNSSRQLQAPCCDRPEKSLPIILQSICSEQLNTMHSIPNPFARSLVDSVFPVPAGPAGAAPNLILMAPIMVIQQRSVSGVMTNLLITPKYSYPQNISALICLATTKASIFSPYIYILNCWFQIKSPLLTPPSYYIRDSTMSRLCTSWVMSPIKVFRSYGWMLG